MDPMSRSTTPFCHGLACRYDLLDVETCQLLVDCAAVHSIVITDEVTRVVPVGNTSTSC